MYILYPLKLISPNNYHTNQFSTVSIFTGTNDMNCEKLFQYYQFIFHIVGQTSYNPYLCSRNKLLQFTQYIPTIIITALNGSAIMLCMVKKTIKSKDTTDAVVGSLIETFGLFILTATMLQSFIHQQNILKMIKIFQSIELRLYEKFNLKINARSFVKEYLIKVFVAFVLFTLTIVAKFLLSRTKVGVLLELSYSLSRLVTNIIKFHIFFYVNLLNLFIETSCDIHLISNRKLADSHVVRMLKNYKLLHFELYTVAVYINQIFSWSLLLIIIQTLLQLSYSIYWAFYYLSKDKSEYIFLISKLSQLLFVL